MLIFKISISIEKKFQSIRKKGAENMKDYISELKIKEILQKNDHHKDEIIKLFIDKGIIPKDHTT